MDEKTFERLAYDTLKSLEHTVSDVDESLEADLAADVLTLEFDDGRKFIVNSNRAARQVWFAANANAWHFSYDEASSRWIDTRGGAELYAVVGDAVAKKLGRPIALQRT